MKDLGVEIFDQIKYRELIFFRLNRKKGNVKRAGSIKIF